MSEFKNRVKPPFRYDIVGSFLRPDRIKEGRLSYKKGLITKDKLREIEDQEIQILVEKQKELGLKVITDGEFRRSWWHLDFFWGLEGVEKIEIKKGYHFHDEVTRAEGAKLSGKLGGKNHPFVEDFKFIKKFESQGIVARQTIPAPAQFLAELTREYNIENINKYYKDQNELIANIATAYKKVILDLYNAGCRNVQLDDCTWGMLCDKDYWGQRQKGGSAATIDELAELYVKVNNLSIEGLPDDLVLTTHVCRGNYHSTWASQGGYDTVAEYFFGKENAQGYYLEFDDERSGGFEPLKYINGEKIVVLGLISSKVPQLEDKNTVIDKIKKASEFIPLERLCLSPQCGFASTEEGNKLTFEDQWEKLKLVKEIADEVWENY